MDQLRAVLTEAQYANEICENECFVAPALVNAKLLLPENEGAWQKMADEIFSTMSRNASIANRLVRAIHMERVRAELQRILVGNSGGREPVRVAFSNGCCTRTQCPMNLYFLALVQVATAPCAVD